MSDAPEVRLLLFRVGDLVCAADVDRVREILPRLPATRIPGAPAAVTGVANVRGTLVTVVEAWRLLRRGPANGEGGRGGGGGGGSPGGSGGGAEGGRAGSTAAGAGPGIPGEGATTVLLEVGSGRRLVALTVDEVMDLLVLDGDALEHRQELPGLDPALVRAVGRWADRLFVVLDADALLSPILSA
jgi:chemotaxis signal transduction protein